MARTKKDYFKLIAVVAWIVTTLALAGWWFIFALRLIGETSDRQHRMLIMEGGFLFILLLIGGVTLLYYISRETKRANQIQIFFTSFTHDLKTSLASLRLQAESLEEDLKGADEAKLLKRLVKDTVRLQLQLENSLFVANPQMAALHIEEISLERFFKSLALEWPDLKLDVQAKSKVKADPRALESVFKNLIQNAVVHGQANEVRVAEHAQGNIVSLLVTDEGRGFVGDPRHIAQPFHQHHGGSGSGVGLYLVKMLVEKMNGKVIFNFSPKFSAEVKLPKAGGV